MPTQARPSELVQSLRTFYRDPLIHCIHHPVTGSLGAQSTDQNLRTQQTDRCFERGRFSLIDVLIDGLQKSLERWTNTEWFAVISHESHPLISINELLSTLQNSPLDGYLHAEAIIPGHFQSQWQATCWQRYGNTQGCSSISYRIRLLCRQSMDAAKTTRH